MTTSMRSRTVCARRHCSSGRIVPQLSGVNAIADISIKGLLSGDRTILPGARVSLRHDEALLILGYVPLDEIVADAEGGRFDAPESRVNDGEGIGSV